jgi:outer membrane receptor protein involved in Fe transport
VTSNSGSYRISTVPPGNYKIVCALSGFASVEKAAVVQLDRTATANVSLQISAREEVIVTGEATVIDSTSSATGSNFTSEFMRTLPIGRGFQAVATKAPGVIQGFGADQNNIAVLGSTGAENNFIIDGVDTTEIQYGRQGKTVVGEFVQEVEVKAGGYQAEYGHSQGGVLNAITKQGGNEFHGDAFVYYAGRSDEPDSGNFWLAEDDNLQAKADSLGTFRAQTDVLRNTRTADYGAALGGYFWKDRIWFFGAYDKVKTEGLNFLNTPAISCTTTPCPSGTGPGTGALSGGTTDRNVDQELYAGKLTFRFTDGLSLVGSVFGDPTEIGPNLRTPLAAEPPGTYRGTLKQGGTDYTGRLQGVVGSEFLFELQAARHEESNENQPANTADRLFITTVPAGQPRQGGYGFYQVQDFTRDYYRGALSYYLNILGAHELKAGGDYAQVQANSQRFYTGPAGRRETIFVRNYANGETIYQHEYYSTGGRDANGSPILIDANPVEVSHTSNTGAFFQDTWQIFPNLTLNLGVRWEDQKVKDINEVTQIHINDEWMPRLGFAWDVLGGGRSRVFGNYARFYQTMPMDINIRAYGLEVTTAVWNRDPDSLVADPTVCGVKPDRPTACTAGRHATIRTGGSFGEPTQPGLKGQYSDEYSLGFEFQPIQDLAVGAKYVYRTLGRVVEDGGALNADGDLEYFIFNPGTDFVNPANGQLLINEDVPKRYYKGVILTAQKRFNNKLQFIASYTWSKLEGNYDGVFQTSTTQLDPNINSAFDYPEFFVNTYGYLSNDRRHVVKVDGSYITPFRLTVGLSAFYYDGTPLNQYGFNNAYRNYELYLVRRGSVGRTPDIYDADLHLGYSIPVGPVSISLGADVFNVLNQQRVLAQDQRFDETEGGPQQANYLRPISFTGRRSLRLSTKVSF